MRTTIFASMVILSTAALAADPGAQFDYWSAKYDGADLLQGQYACKAPAIPQFSETNQDIKRVTDDYNAWQACYQAAAAHFEASLPPGKAIPAEVMGQFTDAQKAAVMSHMNEVYTKVQDTLAGQANGVTGEYDRWHAATFAYVQKANKANQDARFAQNQAELDIIKRQRDMQRATSGVGMTAPRTK